MTVSEARRILNAKPTFGSKPDPKLHRQAREVIADWERYQAMNGRTEPIGARAALLRKHPSFARPGSTGARRGSEQL